MHFDAEFYVAVGFTIFVLVLLWVGAHSKFTAMIDARIDRINPKISRETLRSLFDPNDGKPLDPTDAFGD